MATRYKLREGLWTAFVGGARVRQGEVLEGARWAALVPAVLESFEVMVDILPEPFTEAVAAPAAEPVVPAVAVVVAPPITPPPVAAQGTKKQGKRHKR